MRRKILALLVGCSAIGVPWAQEPSEGEVGEKDRMLYAVGFLLARNLSAWDLSRAELAKVQEGLIDGAERRDPYTDLEAVGPRLETLIQQRIAMVAEREEVAGEQFRREAASVPGVLVTESGLVYEAIEEGSGPRPSANDTVQVHYQGMLRDGTVFDSSRSAGEGEAATVPLGGVIPCFREGTRRMSLGGKSKFICPPNLAYAELGSPPKILPGATLVFQVELLGFVSAAEPADTPERSDEAPEAP